MAYRRESPPEGNPVIRAPLMVSGPPPSRPPPRAVHFDNRPSYLESPPRGSGRFSPGDGTSPPDRFFRQGRGAAAGTPRAHHRRFADHESPPQRYLEGPPPGYQDSPPRTFPGRTTSPHHHPHYLSPEDSPPYRYIEDAPLRQYVGGPSRPPYRPFSEDDPLPGDIDGPTPGFSRDEGPRRFGGHGRFPGGFRGERHLRNFPGSESPSPPPDYFPPPPPPPGGRYGSQPPPRQLSRYADDDSPPRYAADENRQRFGGGRGAPPRTQQQFDDGSPPGGGARGGYEDEAPGTFAGTPPLQFHDGSSPETADEPPRRFAEGSPPSPPPGGPREVSNAPRPVRRPPAGPPPPPPPGHHWDDSPPTPPQRFAVPCRQFPDESPPPGPPGDAERGFAGAAAALPGQSDPLTTRGFAGAPPQQVSDPPTKASAAGALPQQSAAAAQGGGPPGGYSENPGVVKYTQYTGTVNPPQFADGPPAGPPGGPGPSPGPPGIAEDRPRRTVNTPPQRQVPDGSPPGPQGYAGRDGSRGFAGAAPLRHADGSPQGLPGYPGPPPPGAAPLRGSPPPAHFRFPPDVFGTRPLPPDVFVAPALADRPHHGSASASPGQTPVRYNENDLLPLRPPGTPDSSSPDIYGGPRYRGAARPPDIYGALPSHVTPPREQYRPPPPGLGAGGSAPLLGLPPGYATPQRLPPAAAHGSSPPQFLFTAPRRHPDGYRATTPPQQPPLRPPGLGHDAIFTADVVPIELDDKLKELQPHQGNPGSASGGAWKDLWAALIFVLQIGAIAALSVIFGLQGLANTINHYNAFNSFHINDWFPQLAAAAVVGAVFACIWQNAIRMAPPVIMILVTIWTGSALMILVGIVLIATGQTMGLLGLAFLFVGLCQALYAFVVRDRIPFAGEMLKKVVSVCSTYPSTYAVSYIILLVSLAFLALWIFGFSGSGIRAYHAAIMAGFVVSLLWTMQVLRNIVRVTVAETVALFYFQEHNMPAMPTQKALVRACTLSLGSICFGSFFVPLVEAPCHALQRLNSQAGASEFLFSCILCMLSCFNYLIRYFNRMGYIQVAIYGKPFLRASKDTWDMLCAQEVDVLVHDDLIGTIFFLACGIGGSLSALVGGIYSFIVHKSLTIIITVISYLIGALITYVTMAVLESAVATYYVCFAEDPASLQRYDGPFYERMWVRQMELQTPLTELTA